MNYVAGFLFSLDKKLVVLIQKEKPKWQKGKLNGVGGKIEPGETPYAAMCREFAEEAGLHLTGWRPFTTYDFKAATDPTLVDGTVHFFKVFLSENLLYSAQTMTEEKIGIFCVEDIPKLPVIPNLRWLIPMALEDHITAAVTE